MKVKVEGLEMKSVEMEDFMNAVVKNAAASTPCEIDPKEIKALMAGKDRWRTVDEFWAIYVPGPIHIRGDVYVLIKWYIDSEEHGTSFYKIEGIFDPWIE